MISDFGRHMEKTWLVLEESAGEAACRGRERVGVLKIEDHSPPSEFWLVCLGIWIVTFWFCVRGFGLWVCGLMFCVFGVCRFIQIAPDSSSLLQIAADNSR